MTQIHKTFLILLALELVFLFYTLIPTKTYIKVCEDPTYSFFYPFGKSDVQTSSTASCFAIRVENQNHYIFLATDLLILTGILCIFALTFQKNGCI